MRILGLVVLICVLVATSCAVVPAGQIAEIKARAADGSTVNVWGAVTASFHDCWYVQDQDGITGIKLKMAPYYGVSTGSRLAGFAPITEPALYLSLVGSDTGIGAVVVGTDPNGERYIQTLPVYGVSVAEVQMPAACVVTNQLLGGCNFPCADGVNVGQIGVYRGCGPNNVGSLVQTCGYVTGHDASLKCFYIDDGTMPFDGSGRRRIMVSYADQVPPIWIPAKYTRVKVRGICSIYPDVNGCCRAMIRLRSPTDVQLWR